MRNKEKIIISIVIIGIMLNVLFINISNVLASDNTIYISLTDSNITVDNVDISKDVSEDVYLSNIMDNGGTSNDSGKANIEIANIININDSGTYEFTGQLSDGQISINSNKINGDVTIILNNVDITCKKAPAIFVYNTETKSSTCNIKIKTTNGSENTIAGGKIKQSVEEWSDQSEILYYIDKGYDDDKNYYERYKYDGAISSDISLTFEGDGTLIVNSLSKEGIETKRDITINSGNYIINSLDDGINASADNESVITINGGNILVNVLSEADEGDGIDSNGYIYINGGTVYAFASETSQDNGVDSDSGIYINGGIVVATGNMADSVSKESEQEFMQMQFKDKVSKDTLITILDEEKNPIVAFKSDRAYSVLTISTPDFSDEEHYVYEGGNIEGVSQNGLYTEIVSYTDGTKKEYSLVSDMRKAEDFQNNMKNINMNKDKIYYCTIIILVVILIIFTIILIKVKKKGEFEMKGKILTLFIGILIGAIITTAGFLIYNKVSVDTKENQGMMDRKEMQNGGEMPNGEKPEGEPPEMPNDDGNLTRPEKPSQEQSSSNNL